MILGPPGPKLGEPHFHMTPDLTILPVPTWTSLDAREGKPKNTAKPLPEMAVKKDSKDG